MVLGEGRDCPRSPQTLGRHCQPRHELAFEGRPRRVRRSLEYSQRVLTASRLPSEPVRYRCRGRLSSCSVREVSVPSHVTILMDTIDSLDRVPRSLGSKKQNQPDTCQALCCVAMRTFARSPSVLLVILLSPGATLQAARGRHVVRVARLLRVSTVGAAGIPPAARARAEFL